MSQVAELLAIDLTTKTIPVPLHVDKEGKVFGVNVLSSDSPACEAERNRQRQENTVFLISRGGKRLDPDASEDDAAIFNDRLRKATTGTALAATAGWYGMFDGKTEMAYDPKVMQQLYDKFPSWREKVANVSDGVQAPFLNPSPKESAST